MGPLIKNMFVKVLAMLLVALVICAPSTQAGHHKKLHLTRHDKVSSFESEKQTFKVGEPLYRARGKNNVETLIPAYRVAGLYRVRE
ncbi:hypothetical protein PRUPE_2G220300 [Prunus persica]|uniref:Uncharacterized protein n=1 Tax=Prunus persica TaxID=3760 RepID=A0A251QJM4_PRUPE|nr:hypothetical protein PRUPE_2G220300 [Prunus persica]